MSSLILSRQVDLGIPGEAQSPLVGPDGTIYTIYEAGPSFSSYLELAILAPGASSATTLELQNSGLLGTSLAVFDPNTSTIWVSLISSENYVARWDLSGNQLSYFQLRGPDGGQLQATGPSGTNSGIGFLGCPVVGPDKKIWFPFADENNKCFVAVVDPNTPAAYEPLVGTRNPLSAVAFGFDSNSSSAQAEDGYIAACADDEYVYIAGGLSQGVPTGPASVAYIYQVAIDGSFTALAIPGIGPYGSTVSPMNVICLGPPGYLLYAGNHQGTEDKITLGSLNISTGACIESQAATTNRDFALGLCYDSDTGFAWILTSEDYSFFVGIPQSNGGYTISSYTFPSGSPTYMPYYADGLSAIVYGKNAQDLIYGVFQNSSTNTAQVIGLAIAAPVVPTPPPPGLIIIPPYLNLQSAGEYEDAAPNAPTIVSAEQASGLVVIGFLPAPISGITPTSSFNLYRSISSENNFSLIATNLISLTSVENLIFDRDAETAVRYDYYVCAVDQNGNISQPSNVVSFTPFDPLVFSRTSASRNISDAAFGPYPVLGSDLYLDSVGRDIVIGPNGDYLAVNGLELLAQDLRIRFLTEVGELSLHQTFGFDRSSFIGSGIANRQLQAQRLYTAFSSMLLAEPRVSSVLDVQISQTASDGWIVTYIITAIGSEDPTELNLVVPFLGGGTRNAATALPNSAVLVLPNAE